MEIKKIEYDLTICKVKDEKYIDLSKPFYFIGKTDEEISIVCLTSETPSHTVAREDGWNAFRVEGILDFSMIGLLSRISMCLAHNEISIFAVSTFNTDYILVKKEDFSKALNVLAKEGFVIVE